MTTQTQVKKIRNKKAARQSSTSNWQLKGVLEQQLLSA